MSIVKRFFFTGFCVLAGFCAFSQAARSPFTTLGIGETYGNALINSQGMAGVGISQPQFWYLNNQNPALLVYNNLTVFQAGIVLENRMLKNDTASQRSTGGNMNYLATAFPVKPGKWTTSLGLMPYSSVNYDLQYVAQVENSTDKVGITEEGTGGLTQLYWSNGVRLHRNFAIGAKASYIFSSLVYRHTNQLIGSTQPINFPITIQQKTYVKDFMFSGGVSYSADSLFKQKKYRLSVGAVYNLEADLDSKERFEIYRSTSVGDMIDPDTLYSLNGSINIPSGFTAGLSLSHTNKWTIGTDFSYQDWSSFRSVNRGEPSGTFWRIAVGAEATPNFLDESYLKRVTYRIGLSYEKTPFLVDVDPDPDITQYRDVKDIGMNVGFSLPAGRSSLDFAIRYGKRGDRNETLLQENYFKIYFGITFNDQWFIKRKFD